MPIPSDLHRRSHTVPAALLALALIAPLGSLAISQVPDPAAKPKTEPAADPLMTLTNASRAIYTMAKQNALAAQWARDHRGGRRRRAQNRREAAAGSVHTRHLPYAQDV